MSSLTIHKIHELDNTQAKHYWMIEELWLDNGVGLIGGEPKSYKTFAALSLAVATSSGQPCFGHYAVRRVGPVLLYAAEDSLLMIRERVFGIAMGMGADFAQLNIYVIAEPNLRIDVHFDRQRLEEAIIDIKPALLLLDPFVRLHSIDENSSGEVAKVLSWLRGLQRKFGMNIVMVHHARKRAGKERPGQSLRGSSELHAWGDSNLYLRRVTGEEPYVELTTEHRAASSQENIRLRLHVCENGPYLIYEGEGATQTPAKKSTEDRVLAALQKEYQAGETLRKACTMRSQIFWTTLNQLVESGRVDKLDEKGYRLLPSLAP